VEGNPQSPTATAPLPKEPKSEPSRHFVPPLLGGELLGLGGGGVHGKYKIVRKI